MLLKKFSISIALFFLLMLSGIAAGWCLQQITVSDDIAETEWLMEQETENREGRGSETAPGEEVTDQTGPLQYLIFATSSNYENSINTAHLPDVFIDNTTPPPNC